MDAGLSLLGKQAGILPLGYQNVKKKIHRWVNILLNAVAPRRTLNGKFWIPVAQYKKYDHRSYTHQQAEAVNKRTQ